MRNISTVSPDKATARCFLRATLFRVDSIQMNCLEPKRGQQKAVAIATKVKPVSITASVKPCSGLDGGIISVR